MVPVSSYPNPGPSASMRALTLFKIKFQNPILFDDTAYSLVLIENPLLNIQTQKYLGETYSFDKEYPYPKGYTDTISLPIFVDRNSLSFKVLYKKSIVDTLRLNYDLREVDFTVENDCGYAEQWLVAKVVPISISETNQTLKASIR